MANLLNELKVAIVGAGLSGLSTANVLLKLGCRSVVVLEKTSSSNCFSSSLSNNSSIIGANGVRVLDSLGLAASSYSSGQPLYKFTQKNLRNDVLSTFNPTSVIHENIKSGAKLTSLAIQRSTILKLLTKQLPNNTIQYNTTVTGVQQIDDEKYEIKTNNSSKNNSGSENQQADEDGFDLIVGADGINSTIRQQYVHLGSGSGIRELNGLLVQGITSSSSLASPDQSNDELLEYWGNGQRFGCCRLSADKVWWYASVHSSFKAAADSPTAFSQIFSSFPDNIASLINSTPTASYQAGPLIDLPPSPPFYKDGVALVGSAAASLTIDYHQQPAQCLESAAILGFSLVSSSSVSEALDRYSRARVPRLAFLSSASFSESQSALQKSKFMSSLRDMATSIMPKQVSNATYESAITYSIFKDFPEIGKDFKEYTGE